MFKSLLPWKQKHNKTKVMAAERTMDQEVILQNQNLLPCQVCGRTFLPLPLKKHEKVCQKNACKKRKIFNSLKQRVEGTDLAIFHMNHVLKPSMVPVTQEQKNPKQSKWKENHLELVNAIRAARGVNPVASPTQKKSTSSLMVGNERCPSCDRQFGPKAFDRHVEWCKEHKARIQKSPASVQLAKERLEARTKYRVPPLNKSKRSLTREKYSTPEKSPTTPTESLKSFSSTNITRSSSIRRQKTITTIDKNKEKRGSKEIKKKKEPVSQKNDTFIANSSPKLESIKSDNFKENDRKKISLKKPTDRLYAQEKISSVVTPQLCCGDRGDYSKNSNRRKSDDSASILSENISPRFAGILKVVMTNTQPKSFKITPEYCKKLIDLDKNKLPKILKKFENVKLPNIYSSAEKNCYNSASCQTTDDGRLLSNRCSGNQRKVNVSNMRKDLSSAYLDYGKKR